MSRPAVPRRTPARGLALLAAALLGLGVAPAQALAADGTSPAPSTEVVTGELVVAWPDPEPGTAPAELTAEPEDPLTWIRTEDGATVRVPTDDLAGHVADDLPADPDAPDDPDGADVLPAGATVQVTLGGQVADAPAREGQGPARDVLAAAVLELPAEQPTATPAPATAPVTNAVTVALVVPSGAKRDGTKLADVVTGVDQAAAFWAGQSDGAVHFGVTARHDWMTSPRSCSDTTGLWDDVAARIGFVPGPGKHLLLYVPTTPSVLDGCSFGLGEVGSSLTSGGRSYVRGTTPSLIAHELGHNLGLGHSSGRQCDASLESGTCQTVPYRDYHDVMGLSWDELGSLNAPQASRLGFLHGSQVRTVSGSTTVTLGPVAKHSGLRAVRIVDADKASYWLEYRAATGQDAWLGTADNRYGLDTGVQLRRASALPDTSLLLDGTPSRPGGWSADLRSALPVGRAVAVSRGGITVTVVSVTAAGAQVRITTGTPAAVTATPISKVYDRTGGANGPLGYPTAVEECGLRNGGCWRPYDSGVIYWTAARGAHVVTGQLYDAWAASNAENGRLGYPLTDTTCGLRSSGCYQLFEGGSLYVSATTPATVVYGAIRDRWTAAGLETGVLGYPTANETCGLSGGGCLQQFAGGVVAWSPATGARLLKGKIGTAWRTGKGAATIGFPVMDTACGLRDGGCYQLFARGSMYVSAKTPATVVLGAIRDRWTAAKLENGTLGYPTAGEKCGLKGGGCLQSFSGGVIAWSPATGARVVKAKLGAAWRDGRGASEVGFPVMDTACGLRDGGCYQLFTRGSMYVSAKTPATVVRGAIRDRWVAAKLENGALGYPTAGEKCGLAGGGCLQTFSGGVIAWSPATGAQLMTGAIAKDWAARAPKFSGLGYPVAGARTSGSRITQQFQSGSLVSTKGVVTRVS